MLGRSQPRSPAFRHEHQAWHRRPLIPPERQHATVASETLPSFQSKTWLEAKGGFLAQVLCMRLLRGGASCVLKSFISEACTSEPGIVTESRDLSFWRTLNYSAPKGSTSKPPKKDQAIPILCRIQLRRLLLQFCRGFEKPHSPNTRPAQQPLQNSNAKPIKIHKKNHRQW